MRISSKTKFIFIPVVMVLFSYGYYYANKISTIKTSLNKNVSFNETKVAKFLDENKKNMEENNVHLDLVSKVTPTMNITENNKLDSNKVDMSTNNNINTNIPETEDKLEKQPENQLSEEEINKKIDVQYEQVRNKILNEDIDEAWSASAQVQLSSMFGGEELSGIELVEVECRSTMCKMDISITNETQNSNDSENMDLSESTSTVDKLVQITPWRGDTLMEINPEGTIAVIYYSREGHQLITDQE